MVKSFRNVIEYGFDAVPVNGPLCTFETEVNGPQVSQAERTNWYMNRRNSDVNVTPIYPWRRDVTATSNWDTKGLVRSYRDLCTRPEGKEVEGITGLGVRVYKSPIVGLPPLNDVKCANCRTTGKDCLPCEGGNL